MRTSDASQLARAERAGAAPRRRAACLQAAREGLAAAGLLPLAALASLRLARAEPDAEAAADAWRAAEQIAEETGLRLPGLRAAPPPAHAGYRFASLWV
eukprot:tig00000475_g1227.t1